MHELFPFIAGIVIGIIVHQIRSPKYRTGALVVLCLLVGALASFISGELELSWGFISLDALLVWAGALVATILTALWRRRAALR